MDGSFAAASYLDQFVDQGEQVTDGINGGKHRTDPGNHRTGGLVLQSTASSESARSQEGSPMRVKA